MFLKVIHVKINELEEKSKLDQLVTTENIKMQIGGETGIHGYRGSNSDSDWLDDDITWQHRSHSDWWRRARAFFYKNDFRYKMLNKIPGKIEKIEQEKQNITRRYFSRLPTARFIVNKFEHVCEGVGVPVQWGPSSTREGG